jgi:hypothetical protein
VDWVNLSKDRDQWRPPVNDNEPSGYVKVTASQEGHYTVEFS